MTMTVETLGLVHMIETNSLYRRCGHAKEMLEAVAKYRAKCSLRRLEASAATDEGYALLQSVGPEVCIDRDADEPIQS